MISPKTNQEMRRAEQVPHPLLNIHVHFLFVITAWKQGEGKGLGEYQIFLRGQSHARHIEYNRPHHNLLDACFITDITSQECCCY